MIIGVPREIKIEEFRVGLTPVGARELAHGGHTVLVETDAGAGSGFLNDAYCKAGAETVPEGDGLQSCGTDRKSEGTRFVGISPAS